MIINHRIETNCHTTPPLAVLCLDILHLIGICRLTQIMSCFLPQPQHYLYFDSQSRSLKYLRDMYLSIWYYRIKYIFTKSHQGLSRQNICKTQSRQKYFGLVGIGYRHIFGGSKFNYLSIWCLVIWVFKDKYIDLESMWKK